MGIWREIVLLRWHRRVMAKEMVMERETVMEKAGRKETAKVKAKERPGFDVTADRRAICPEIAGKQREKVKAKGSNGERELTRLIIVMESQKRLQK